MIELRNAIRNICEETVKALAEADSNMRHYAYCSIEGRVTLDITLRGVEVDGILLSPTGKDYMENEVSVKGIELVITPGCSLQLLDQPDGSRHHVPDPTPQP